MSFCLLCVFVSGLFCFLSSLGGRDARPCVPRVRSRGCPASALKCLEPGPLGDASESFSLVVAYVSVCSVVVSSCVWLTMCESVVK